jgi:hypothetical protein
MKPRSHRPATRALMTAAIPVGLAAITVALATTPGASTEPSPAAAPSSHPRELGFVLTAFAPAIYQGKDDCPDGLVGTVRENYLDSLPEAERARLLLKVNEPELTARWKAYALGPEHTNICANPEKFSRPVAKLIEGPVARGLNLDGDSGSGASDGCAHDNFTAPDGEKGIDNQAYRALGCTRNYRGVDGLGGDGIGGQNAMLATGEQSKVLLLRGVDSLANDPDVEVIFATTDDRPVLDSKRNFITGASFSVTDNPAWRNVLHGRIVNGVLTTDPADIRVSRRMGHGGAAGLNAEFDMRRGRFRLAFQPDGSVKGLFGAYQPMRNVIVSTINGGIGAAETAGIDCAAEYAALTKLADGLKDPKTGRCTAISAALDVAAVPAFVIDRPPHADKPRIAAR